MTAAHRDLPLGTLVRVTNLDNGKSVDVRINDRGPFVHGRVIDLSQEAARRLDLIGPGVGPGARRHPVAAVSRRRRCRPRSRPVPGPCSSVPSASRNAPTRHAERVRAAGFSRYISSPTRV